MIGPRLSLSSKYIVEALKHVFVLAKNKKIIDFIYLLFSSGLESAVSRDQGHFCSGMS